MWKSAFHRRVMHLSASAGATAFFSVRSYIRNLSFPTPKICIYAPKNRPSGFLHMEIVEGRYTFLTTKKLFIDGLTDRWTTGRTPPDTTGRTKLAFWRHLPTSPIHTFSYRNHDILDPNSRPEVVRNSLGDSLGAVGTTNPI
jgi:hypothetical protein